MSSRQDEKTKAALKHPVRQFSSLVPTEAIVLSSGSEPAAEGEADPLPEDREWFWTTRDAVAKAAAKLGCNVTVGPRLAETSTQASVKVLWTQKRSHEIAEGTKTKNYPEGFRSVAFLHVDQRVISVTVTAFPGKSARDARGESTAKSDECLEFLRTVMADHGAFLKDLFGAALVETAARDRMSLLLDEVATNSTFKNWFRTLTCTVGPCDAPLLGAPMLLAQLDATLWIDITCCGYGPVIFSLSGAPAAAYDDACAAADAKDKMGW